jgi:hypothetical protein
MMGGVTDYLEPSSDDMIQMPDFKRDRETIISKQSPDKNRTEDFEEGLKRPGKATRSMTFKHIAPSDDADMETFAASGLMDENIDEVSELPKMEKTRSRSATAFKSPSRELEIDKKKSDMKSRKSRFKSHSSGNRTINGSG